jgi:high-affinity iron transporter
LTYSEVAECGVFLLPFFLENSNLKAIPVSAVSGSAIALLLGFGIYFANHRMTNKFWLAFTMAGLTLFLAVGLFVGGCHEFEEVWGETRKVWTIENDFFSHKEFPFVLLKPFGWSSSRTVLQITTFWCSLAVGLTYHWLKYRATCKARELYPAKELADEELGETTEGTKSDDKKVLEDSHNSVGSDAEA